LGKEIDSAPVRLGSSCPPGTSRPCVAAEDDVVTGGQVRVELAALRYKREAVPRRPPHVTVLGRCPEDRHLAAPAHHPGHAHQDRGLAVSVWPGDRAG